MPPRLDYARELGVQDGVRALIRMGLVRSAHDVSEGGLAAALAESCLGNGLGAAVELPANGLDDASLAVALFNESQSRVVISVGASNAAAVEALLRWRGVEVARIGTVGGDGLAIRAAGREMRWGIDSLRTAWEGSIGRWMES
jgi:phosphoribosylformylglycinamidine synthase